MTHPPSSVALADANRKIILTNMAIASLFTLAVTLFYWWIKFDGNITGFFRIGDVLPLSPYLDAAQTKIYPNQLGYDGQFFLTLGLDPGLTNPDSIAALDGPPYRYQRILYPLLGYLLGLGKPALIPYALVAINMACITGLVGLMSWAFTTVVMPKSTSQSTFQSTSRDTARGNAASADAVSPEATTPNWLPLLTLCIPGIWMILGFSTADLLSSLLLVTAFCCYHRGRLGQTYKGQTAGAIALACLTRETMAIGWIALLIDSLRRKNWPQVGALLMAICPVAAWRQYVNHSLAQYLNNDGVTNNFVFPFTGIAEKLSTLLQAGLESNNLFEAYAFLLLMGIFASLLWNARESRHTFAIWLAGLLYAVLFISSAAAILEYFLGYSRVYVDAFLLLLLSWGLGQPTRGSNKSDAPRPTLLQPQGLLLVAGIVPSLAFILLSN